MNDNIEITYEPAKHEFVKSWGPRGYRENFDVYSKQSGVSEQKIVETCLSPFYDKSHHVLEIGCGGCYWPEKYLCQNFGRVTGLDVLPAAPFKAPNFRYIEVPDKNYACFGVDDASVDFVWSFGVFCHLSLASIQTYLNSVYRVLKPGGVASLYFSNSDRRPGCATAGNPTSGLLWCDNTIPKTFAMLQNAGFNNPVDMIPELTDSMVLVRKP